MKKWQDKYFKAQFLTFFITLVNIIYLFHYMTNKYVLYLEEKGTAASALEIFLLAAICIFVIIITVGGFVFIQEETSLIDYINQAKSSTLLSKDDKAKEFYELQKGNLINEKVFSFSHVVEIEENVAKGQEIWIISGDIEEDTQNSELGDTIRKNLERGVIYRYFVSKTSGTISETAKTSISKLQGSYPDYIKNKRLFIDEIAYELVAPDIDIIIYNATATKADSREGYVCIEIGNNSDTYSYQKLTTTQVIGLQEQLGKIDSVTKKSDMEKGPKPESVIGNIIRSVYWIVTVCVFAILSINKKISLFTTGSTVVMACIIWLITTIALDYIDAVVERGKDTLNTLNRNKDIYTKTLKETSVAQELQKQITAEEKTIYSKMQLGAVDNIIIEQDCNYIWIMSDLSHDIASPSFKNWLNDCLDNNQQIKCRILFPDSVQARGRTQQIEYLKKKYNERIELKVLPDSSSDTSHYIWSKTYGVLLLSHEKTKSKLYVSLGTAEKPLYKAVETKEEEIAGVQGTLVTFWDKADPV